jgi:hypothetical protein
MSNCILCVIGFIILLSVTFHIYKRLFPIYPFNFWYFIGCFFVLIIIIIITLIIWVTIVKIRN